jgi:hypothetical protein
VLVKTKIKFEKTVLIAANSNFQLVPSFERIYRRIFFMKKKYFVFITQNLFSLLLQEGTEIAELYSN